MNREELLVKIQEIFIETLDNDEIKIYEETTADDIDEWDSLTHIQLVVEIEKYFKCRFTSSEIQTWVNVGDMISCIQEKNI